MQLVPYITPRFVPTPESDRQTFCRAKLPCHLARLRNRDRRRFGRSVGPIASGVRTHVRTLVRDNKSQESSAMKVWADSDMSELCGAKLALVSLIYLN